MERVEVLEQLIDERLIQFRKDLIFDLEARKVDQVLVNVVMAYVRAAYGMGLCDGIRDPETFDDFEELGYKRPERRSLA